MFAFFFYWDGSQISRLWTRKFEFQNRYCHDVKEVLSTIPVNIHRLMVELYTSEESNLHLLLRAWQNLSSKILFVSKLKEGALPVISALLLQVYQKLFKHKGKWTMLRRGKELELWEVRAKGGKGARSKKNPFCTAAAWLVFFHQ